MNALILAIVLVVVTCAEECLDEWEQFGTKCYHFPSSVYYYDQCENYCAGQDATMMCIEDQEESDFIQDRMYRDMHIGLRQRDGSDEFTWFPNCTSSYTHWMPGEPNGGNGVNGEFVQMYSGTGQWSDYRDEQIYCGCEYQLTVVPPTDDIADDNSSSSSSSSGGCNQTCVLIVIIVAVLCGVGMLALGAMILLRFWFCSGKTSLQILILPADVGYRCLQTLTPMHSLPLPQCMLAGPSSSGAPVAPFSAAAMSLSQPPMPLSFLPSAPAAPVPYSAVSPSMAPSAPLYVPVGSAPPAAAYIPLAQVQMVPIAAVENGIVLAEAHLV
jgi:hypothetical protein